MKTKKSRRIAAFLAVCMTGALAAGCGSGADKAKAPADARTEEQSGAPSADVRTEEQGGASSADARAEEQGGASSAETNEEASAGKWQVLGLEEAAAVDADFLGKVWKIEEDSFYIVEKKVKILEDGSLVTGAPATGADVPDSELIPVIFDGNTCFYVRTISDNGETTEDMEAGFEDLELYISVDLKGRFEHDVFYADEIRMEKDSEGMEYTKSDPVTGIVETYTDSMIVVKDPGDGMTYYFSTEHVRDAEGDAPVAVGDTVEVTYRGVLGNDEKNPGEALKIAPAP